MLNVRKRRNERGFVLVTIAISALLLVGACGFVVDLGRLYVVHNELQVFADSAALSATLRLNGESGGITRARNEVTAMRQRNAWHLDTQTIPAEAVTVEFGRSVSGNAPDLWTATPPDPPASFSFTRVTVRVAAPVYFMPVLTGSTTSYVSATAMAGQLAARNPSGMFPFTPLAHSRTGPDFGLEAGKQYTLKWPSSPKVDHNTCNGDNTQEWIDAADSRGAENRGFYGNQSSASTIWSQVANDTPVEFYGIGDRVPLSGGAMTTVANALAWRINSDPDPSSTSFSQYRDHGRYRRVITVPLTDPTTNNEIVGWGRFFLLPASRYTNAGGNDPWCAEYIGPGAPEGSDSKGASPGTGMFTKVRLWQ